MNPLRPALALLAIAPLLLAPTAGGAELFGRPLRGLTAVPAGEVAKNPERYAGRQVRVEGTLRREGDGAFSLAQGEGVLRLRGDGFSLPASADGAQAAAEGKIASSGGEGPTLVASGVEVRR